MQDHDSSPRPEQHTAQALKPYLTDVGEALIVVPWEEGTWRFVVMIVVLRL